MRQLKRYLKNINPTSPDPGLYAVRLKHELKKEFFTARRRHSFSPALALGTVLGLALLNVGFLLEPQWAVALHKRIGGEDTAPAAVASPTYLTRVQAAGAGTPATQTNAAVNNGDPLYTLGNQTSPTLSQPRADSTITPVPDGRLVSAEELKQLDARKSYVIRRSDNNQQFYIVSEIRPLNRP